MDFIRRYVSQIPNHQRPTNGGNTQQQWYHSDNRIVFFKISNFFPRFGINAALELTSCMFLLITFLVYVFLPLLQNLHGKTLMCHVASLFVAYACLAAIALTKPPDPTDTSAEDNSNNEISSAGGGGCKFLGYTTLFSFLAAFSWLNVMCFDIWWTFG